MKYLRLTARPPPELAPRAFRLLTASEHVDAARAVTTNITGVTGVTVLLQVAGDRERLLAELSDAPEVVGSDVAPAPEGGFYLLLSLDPGEIPFMAPVFDVVAHERVVIVPPVVYGDGGVTVRLVGNAGAIGTLVEALPSTVDVDVHEVGERGIAVESAAAALSDRQREALRVALELGYYERPRRSTHEDVAAELECAPSTASEHLQKAEAKLVRTAMTDDAGPMSPGR